MCNIQVFSIHTGVSLKTAVLCLFKDGSAFVSESQGACGSLGCRGCIELTGVYVLRPDCLCFCAMSRDP